MGGVGMSSTPIQEVATVIADAVAAFIAPYKPTNIFGESMVG
jgi:hypothetical protein